MAISEFHEATIIKVRVNFWLGRLECSPSDITSTLGIEPDYCYEKGRPWVNRFGRRIFPTENSWGLTGCSESKDVNDHFRQLFIRLPSRRCEMSPAWRERSFEVSWKGNYLYAGSGPFYEADVIAGIAELRAQLFQDIYQIDQDDDEIENTSGLSRIPKRYFIGGGID